MGTTNPVKTKKFRALVAVLGSEDAAVTAWNEAHPEAPIGDVEVTLSPEAQTLVDAGFTHAEAEKYVAQAAAKDVPLSSKEQADVEVAKRGLVHVRGRVYAGAELIEAAVRVLKTGKPEIVSNTGEHRTKGVAVFRTDDGTSVALQNLGVPN